MVGAAAGAVGPEAPGAHGKLAARASAKGLSSSVVPLAPAASSVGVAQLLGSWEPGGAECAGTPAVSAEGSSGPPACRPGLGQLRSGAPLGPVLLCSRLPPP